MESIAEKRFPATPKRKQDARKKGQVLKSQELTSAIMLLALVGLLRFWLPSMFNKAAELFSYITSLPAELSGANLSQLYISIAWQCLNILWPIFLVAVLAALAVNFAQVGVLFSFEPIIPKLSRLSPLEGLKRMFGPKAWMQLAKSLLKVVIIGYFLYTVIRDNMNVFPVLQWSTVRESVVFLANMIFELAWKIALAFLIIAFADFLYQRWEYEKNLRMTFQEIKEEYKQTEGDPQLKAQIKKRQRLLAMRRMMEDLKTADVVVTNPTHLAVALKYDPIKYAAPYVVAKGQDETALRMKKIAGENEIVIMENKPLARALYSQVELGQVVPGDLYKAVAEVLAFVYRLNKRKRTYSA